MKRKSVLMRLIADLEARALLVEQIAKLGHASAASAATAKASSPTQISHDQVTAGSAALARTRRRTARTATPR